MRRLHTAVLCDKCRTNSSIVENAFLLHNFQKFSCLMANTPHLNTQDRRK